MLTVNGGQLHLFCYYMVAVYIYIYIFTLLLVHLNIAQRNWELK